MNHAKYQERRRKRLQRAAAAAQETGYVPVPHLTFTYGYRNIYARGYVGPRGRSFAVKS
jgi:hypothetical protein